LALTTLYFGWNLASAKGHSLTMSFFPFFEANSCESTKPMEDKLPTCRLLLLPGEIRNAIYELLLTSPLLPSLRKAISMNHFSSYVLPALPLTPTLLSTCRQIHAEASPFLYTRNTFTASPTLLTDMPYLVHPSRPIWCPNVNKSIKRWFVNIRIDCDPRFTEDQVTKAFSGVEELEVEATQAMFRASGNGVLLLFKNVRGVSRAVVQGSVDREFAEYLENCMMSPIGSQLEPFDEELARKCDVWTHGNR
jgi:hypothetical protein